ncbi:MAG TPA: phosphoribosylpyrophosphate synthetase [Methylomirabilota bacterium]
MSARGDPTLAGTLDDLARRGFGEHFEAARDGLRAIESGRTYRADELTIRELHRFEGVSDPDDMSIVYAIEGRDGTRGTLVDAFGVYSDPAVSRVIERVPVRRGV